MGSDRSYREDQTADGTPRPGYAALLQALAGADLTQLQQRIGRRLADDGASFGGEPFVVDAVPRLLTAAEWEPLARGLAQRARALNAFLRDVYGEQRIVAAGIVAGDAIEHAEGYEPDLAGRLPQDRAPATIIGFDLVRAPDGSFLVLEDNLRTPSGIAYLTAARAALTAVLPPELPRPRPIDPRIYELLAGALGDAVPPGRRGGETDHPADGAGPSCAVLTDGPGNVALYEHARLAAALDCPLVTLDQLCDSGTELLVELPGSPARPVDVVYRRTDEDRIRDEAGALTAVGAALMPAWLEGRVGLVNAFGNGVADDKLIHGHVEDFVGFYLGEEPLVRSVPTAALDAAGDNGDTLGRLAELVVKPRHGHGGIGVTIGAQADAEQLNLLRDELERHPERYIVQPIVPLSRHPTVIDGRLEPRYVDLRPFAFCGEAVTLAPGGLSRVSFAADEMVVNSSRDGGGKDTWVIA